MAKHNEKVNPIPARTWNWLGVNESTLNMDMPVVTAYRKQPVFQRSEAVKIGDIGSFKDTIKHLENQLEAGVSDSLSHFAADSYNSGYFIEIEAGKKAETPVVLQYDLNEENPVLVDNHFILARENSEITVVINYLSQEGSKGYHNGVTRIVAQAGAKVHLVKVQMLSGDAVHIDAVGAITGDQGRVDCTLIELGAQQVITNCKNRLTGTNSDGNINSIYFGDQNRQLDINYVLTYQARETSGVIKARGALLDNSQKIFRGTLDFIRGAKGANGKEEEYAVLLSPNVRNRSVPLMLCGEDAVQGQHAASAGRLDEDKMFYLMSRGLSETDAKKLIIEAAFQPILEEIPILALREEISGYVKRRLHHVQ